MSNEPYSPPPVQEPSPVPPPQPSKPVSERKLVAGLLGILLNGLGVHKFYLGYQKEGLIMLLVTVLLSVLTCGVGYIVMGVIGLIEGILYLTKSDEEFERTYLIGRKGWF
jgi:TM2 domain-containing membrane protein YozV